MQADATPTAQHYADAFCRPGILSDDQIRMLRIHYHAFARTITSKQLAHSLGLRHYPLVNARYGRLGRLVGERLGYNPMHEHMGTLVTFDKRDGEWHWLLRPQVAEALELLEWTGDAVPIPEPDLEYGSAREGRPIWALHLRRERNPMLVRRKKAEVRRRKGCLACEVCGLHFDDLPLGLGEACCEVHHGRPLGDSTGEVETTFADLHVLCANCHRMIHPGSCIRS